MKSYLYGYIFLVLYGLVGGIYVPSAFSAEPYPSFFSKKNLEFEGETQNDSGGLYSRLAFLDTFNYESTDTEVVGTYFDNFISLTRSNFQNNEDLFLFAESKRRFKFNSIKSYWHLGGRYSNLEGVQLWVKNFCSSFSKKIDELNTQWGVQVGRFYWSDLRLDSFWGLGLVEPHFRGDPLAPLRQGLTGMNFWAQLGEVKLSLFGSPIGIPDIGPSFSIKNGRIISSSPWFVGAPAHVFFLGNKIDLNYNSDFSGDRLDILLNPSLLGKMVVKDEKFAVQILGGYVPSNQFFLKIHPKAKVNDFGNAFIEANVDTQLLTKSIMSASVKKDFKHISLWSEFYSEKVDTQDLFEVGHSKDYFFSKVFDQEFFGAGADFKFNWVSNDLKASISYLKSMNREEKVFVNSFNFSNYVFLDAVSTSLDFYNYYLGVQFKLDFKYDLMDDSFLLSPRVSYLKDKDVKLFAQFDLLGSAIGSAIGFSKGSGFLSRQLGNDRISIGVAYAL